MCAVTGITGKVGGTVAQTLLQAGYSVRAVVRSPEKGQVWDDLGCEIAIASAEDFVAMAAAFVGVDGVFFIVRETLAGA